MKVKCNVLDRQFFQYQQEYEAAALRVLRSGWYVLGNEVKQFEEEFAAFTGRKYCVGLNSGLDALIMSVRALGISQGDEVIVQANTYIATVLGITENGATPVFVEPDEYFGINVKELESKITDKTKAILVVHLYGIATPMDEIVSLCEKYHLKLVEDCAQSHGACYKGKMTGTFGDVGCFSFYPSKNLGAFGDGGAVVVKDEALAKEFKVFRNYGSEKRYYNTVVGTNSRLDEIQAGLLRIRLSHMEELTQEKIAIASRYTEGIHNPKIKLPQIPEGATCVYHQYVIRCEERDRLIEYLNEKEIGTIIHYPIPPHLAEAYRYLGHHEGDFPITEHLAKTVLSIPMYNGMTEEEQDVVIDALNRF